jgi:hypothetical protein
MQRGAKIPIQNTHKLKASKKKTTQCFGNIPTRFNENQSIGSKIEREELARRQDSDLKCTFFLVR